MQLARFTTITAFMSPMYVYVGGPGSLRGCSNCKQLGELSLDCGPEGRHIGTASSITVQGNNPCHDRERQYRRESMDEVCVCIQVGLVWRL